MPKKPKSTKAYPKELRDKAVKLVSDCGYTIEQVAEQLGCSKESVRRWKEATKSKVDPETARRMEQEESELKRLRNECIRLRMENDILKKATAYFARETM
jgi:transposase